MSAKIQAKTRALQWAGLLATLSYSSYQEASSADGVDSSDKTLAARVQQPLLPLRLYGCGAHVCKNPGRGAQSVTGSARAPVTTDTYPTTSPWAGRVTPENKLLAARLRLPLISPRLDSYGVDVRGIPA